ncbi:avidin-related protein 1-like [Phasianus colchicus]|uniref:avidin-related protein 1-like n=1 Tax=Phasianus colchicus TaxID=9054 RepID=UPI00129EDD99|nr:avidin-related protein 1-like [Phasianus colchicus]
MNKLCLLTGNWRNDLGSSMIIGAVNDRGEFSGSYLTAVADAPNNITWSPLLGIQNNTVCQPTFGFTVQWTFIESTTVFTGQCFIDRNGKEVLKTKWLLRSSVGDIDDDWKATRVGNNDFTRMHTVQNEDDLASPTSATTLEC